MPRPVQALGQEILQLYSRHQKFTPIVQRKKMPSLNHPTQLPPSKVKLLTTEDKTIIEANNETVYHSIPPVLKLL